MQRSLHNYVCVHMNLSVCIYIPEQMANEDVIGQLCVCVFVCVCECVSMYVHIHTRAVCKC